MIPDNMILDSKMSSDIRPELEDITGVGEGSTVANLVQNTAGTSLACTDWCLLVCIAYDKASKVETDDMPTLDW